MTEWSRRDLDWKKEKAAGHFLAYPAALIERFLLVFGINRTDRGLGPRRQNSAGRRARIG